MLRVSECLPIKPRVKIFGQNHPPVSVFVFLFIFLLVFPICISYFSWWLYFLFVSEWCVDSSNGWGTSVPTSDRCSWLPTTTQAQYFLYLCCFSFVFVLFFIFICIFNLHWKRLRTLQLPPENRTSLDLGTRFKKTNSEKSTAQSQTGQKLATRLELKT